MLRLAERPMPVPQSGEVRVRVEVSGINPTDWKARVGASAEGAVEKVPHQDGAGVIDAVGEGIDPVRIGERVWLWEAAWERVNGTAQEYLALPARQAVSLPAGASFELGASLGIPALTAHRALTAGVDGPRRLGAGALAGKTVLVAGGAGVVGNAAIQLARWAGARVITTVSSERKATLARAAGAHHVVNYREAGAASAIRRAGPGGVDIVVAVAPGPNAALNREVAAQDAVIAFYALDGGTEIDFPADDALFGGQRWQGIFVYRVPAPAKDEAVAAVGAAVADNALRVGESAGLPLHTFPLRRVADAHAAVEGATVGKVLLAVSSDRQI